MKANLITLPFRLRLSCLAAAPPQRCRTPSAGSRICSSNCGKLTTRADDGGFWIGHHHQLKALGHLPLKLMQHLHASKLVGSRTAINDRSSSSACSLLLVLPPVACTTRRYLLATRRAAYAEVVQLTGSALLLLLRGISSDGIAVSTRGAAASTADLQCRSSRSADGCDEERLPIPQMVLLLPPLEEEAA